MRTCSLPFCDRPFNSHDLCLTHSRHKRAGKALAPIKPLRNAGEWGEWLLKKQTGYVYRYKTGDPATRQWQHRFVMEQNLGRKLLPSEQVHHINGIRHDNRLENLQLRTTHHGAGIKQQCLDCGSHNVVAVLLD